ncbi:hypothetical protein CBER1_05767 [Cercospora berteroae]|uniref:Uncharacterized protein n=1 Tax=Cercospora berteroae TaxID=357750 RepID=A0A2S6CHX8_9PEZI|nr:hypothetical protein CBER1_05767 [Cercospora berteroae]
MASVSTPAGLAEENAVRNSVGDRFRVSGSRYGVSGNSSFSSSTLPSTNDSGYNSNSASTGMPHSNATIDRAGRNYAIERYPELWNQTRGAATTPTEYNTSAQSFGQAQESYPQRRASSVTPPPISAIMQGNAARMESAGNSETAVVSDDPQTESNYILDSGTGLVHIQQPTPIDLLTQPVNFDASRMHRFHTGPSDEEQSGRGYAGTPRALRNQHYRSA